MSIKLEMISHAIISDERRESPIEFIEMDERNERLRDTVSVERVGRVERELIELKYS